MTKKIESAAHKNSDVDVCVNEALQNGCVEKMSMEFALGLGD